jgi:hypothetical protein
MLFKCCKNGGQIDTNSLSNKESLQKTPDAENTLIDAGSDSKSGPASRAWEAVLR